MNITCTTSIEAFEPLELYLNNGHLDKASDFLDTIKSKGCCYKNWEAYRLISRGIASNFTNSQKVIDLMQMQDQFYLDCKLNEFTQEQLSYGYDRVQPFLTRRRVEKAKSKDDKGGTSKRAKTMAANKQVLSDAIDQMVSEGW